MGDVPSPNEAIAYYTKPQTVSNRLGSSRLYVTAPGTVPYKLLVCIRSWAGWTAQHSALSFRVNDDNENTFRRRWKTHIDLFSTQIGILCLKNKAE